jgi:uncharacterized protein (TIGR00369 family)
MTKQPNSRFCFVCGLENPNGLHLHFYQTSPGEVSVRYRVPDKFQGYPGVVHGGIVAAMLDEATGRALMGTDPENTRFMYTARLDIQYRKPVPTGEELHIVGKATKVKRRSAMAEARIFSPEGEVLAEATAILVDVPAEALDRQNLEILGWKVYPENAETKP